jgi:hypothetical protein
VLVNGGSSGLATGQERWNCWANTWGYFNGWAEHTQSEVANRQLAGSGFSLNLGEVKWQARCAMQESPFHTYPIGNANTQVIIQSQREAKSFDLVVGRGTPG